MTMALPTLPPSPRILALDPGTRYLGLGILCGLELPYHSVIDLRAHRPADALIRATRQIVQRLAAQYVIDTLAYEKTFYVQSKNSALLQVQEMEIRRVGRALGLRVAGYAPTRVRSLLCQDGRATKEEVARLLADRFPQLNEYLHAMNPRQQSYWFHMFDAIAVGVVCAESLGPDRIRRDRPRAA